MNEFSANLIQQMDAIYLTPPHAKMIWQGNKNTIVKSKKMSNLIGKNLYLVEGNVCYGVIKINSIKPISNKEFEESRLSHRISDNERKEWFPHKKVLFSYEFEMKKKFNFPKSVLNPTNSETFINEIKWLKEDKIPEPINKKTPNTYFNNEDRCINYLIDKLTESKSRTLTIERKVKGKRVLLEKTKKEVNLVGTKMNYPTIRKEALLLTGNEIILDGNISGNVFYATDIIKIGETNTMNESWRNRRELLHALKFTPHIKDNFAMVFKDIWKSKDKLKQSMNIFRNLNNSCGCILKNWDSKYLEEWVEYA